MVVTGKLIDADSYEGIPSVSIGVVDEKGYYIGNGTTTDIFGAFSLNNPALTLGGNNQLLITSVGYFPVIADPTVFADTNVYALERKPANLEEFVVTGSAKEKDYTAWYIGGGLLVFLYLTRNWGYTNG